MDRAFKSSSAAVPACPSDRVRATWVTGKFRKFCQNLPTTHVALTRSEGQAGTAADDGLIAEHLMTAIVQKPISVENK